MKDVKNLEVLKLDAGTLIHVNGIPFQLTSETDVLGVKSNLDIAADLSEIPDKCEGS